MGCNSSAHPGQTHMPIYEYQCPQCGNVFEEWVKSSEAHKEEPCPKCGTPSQRILSRTSFVLKGDGWYVSDYGYRKGITEDCGTGAPTPAKAQPVTPATQGDKTLAKTESKEKSLVKTENAPAREAPAPAAPSADS